MNSRFFDVRFDSTPKMESKYSDFSEILRTAIPNYFDSYIRRVGSCPWVEQENALTGIAACAAYSLGITPLIQWRHHYKDEKLRDKKKQCVPDLYLMTKHGQEAVIEAKPFLVRKVHSNKALDQWASSFGTELVKRRNIARKQALEKSYRSVLKKGKVGTLVFGRAWVPKERVGTYSVWCSRCDWLSFDKVVRPGQDSKTALLQVVVKHNQLEICRFDKMYGPVFFAMLDLW